MDTINSQNQNVSTTGARLLIRGVGAFLIIPLLAIFIFNLLLGYQGFAYWILITPFAFFPSFYIASILIVLFFLKHQERGRRFKYVLSIIGLDLIYRTVLFFVAGDGSWGSLGLMIYGILEIATLIIAVLLFLILMRLESKKQMIVIWTVFSILLLLNMIQYFGFLRPGLIE